VRYALFLPIFDELAEPAAVARLAATAEEAGWDGVFVWDHVAYSAPVEAIADPWITLAAIACATERVRLGPMITPLPRRRPVQVAREVATLDRLCAGRVTLGVGIGDDGAGELSGTGEQLDPRIRGQLLDEGLQVLAAAWSGERVHHRSTHYVLDGLALRPMPVQRPHPPVWVAARYGNPAPLRRAARHDGVFPIGLDDADQLREVRTAIDAVRDPGAGAFDVAVGGRPGDDPRPYEAAGATWWMVSFSPYDVSVRAVDAVARGGPPA
jgi:alkanesulfonate monooxygenase SsuD/methylene tetrahydromethanopterin reductase-like flavin-dependent oxidoreductase (luciferase family)